MSQEQQQENKQKIRIGLIFGGRSGEHEVSLASANSVMANLDKDKDEAISSVLRRKVASYQVAK